nr:exopolysaccharide biosynthesis polyprenyl glycosylphosphotransferase [Caulobacter segnis]
MTFTAEGAGSSYGRKGPENITGLKRRGPLRPGRLVPSRARMSASVLAQASRLLDLICAAAVAAGLALLGHPLVGVLWACSLLIAIRILGGYAFPRQESLKRHLTVVGRALALALAAALIAALPWRQTDGRSLFILLGAGAVIALLHAAWWTAIARGRRLGRLTPNIVLIGATPNAERLIQAALRTGQVNILGLFDDRLERAPENILGVPLLGDTGALLAHRIAPYVDRVVIAIDPKADTRVAQLTDRLGVLPNPLSLFIDDDDPAAIDAALARIAADAEHPPSGSSKASRRRALAKRLQDLTFASLGLVLTAPTMLAIALAVKLDSPGPIFFRQRRHGFNNEEILVWKFRSMRHELADANAARQIRANDDRVTRVGRFIRKTSLDELPQLFNVLRGEMSMVGPRPHAIGMKTAGVESAQLVAQYAHRHRMKPGMTGWAAINGSRGPVDTVECVRRRVALDVEYIERQSFWLDLYIILMTVPCLIGDRSAVR